MVGSRNENLKFSFSVLIGFMYHVSSISCVALFDIVYVSKKRFFSAQKISFPKSAADHLQRDKHCIRTLYQFLLLKFSHPCSKY